MTQSRINKSPKGWHGGDIWASPGPTGCPAGSRASPAWGRDAAGGCAGAFACEFGEIARTAWEPQGQLEKAPSEPERDVFPCTQCPTGIKKAVFWMHVVLKLSHASGVWEAVPWSAQ